MAVSNNMKRVARGATTEMQIDKAGTYEVCFVEVDFKESFTGVRKDGTSYTTKDTVLLKYKARDGRFLTHNFFVNPVLIDDEDFPGQKVSALSETDLFLLNSKVVEPILKQVGLPGGDTIEMIEKLIADKAFFKVTLTDYIKDSKHYFNYDYSEQTAATDTALAALLSK